MSKGQAAKKAKIDIEEVDSKLVEYMRLQNRPYSLINIFDNLHGAFNKPTLQASLDRLSVTGGPFILKEYGAQKFYFCDQKAFGDCSNDSVVSIEREIATLKADLLKLTNSTTSYLSQCPVSDVSLISDKENILEEIASYKKGIDDLKSVIDPCKTIDIDSLIQKFGRALKESSRRKSLCLTMLDEIGELMNMSRAEVADELALDLY